MFIAKKGFRLTLLIIAFIGIIIGVVYALDFLGIINFSNMASKVPIIGQYFSDNKPLKVNSDNNKGKNEQVKGLMEANQKLADSNKDLQNKLTVMNNQLNKINTEKSDLENKYNEELAKSQAQNDPSQKNLEDEKYRKLAKYYSSMKPDAAVKIMNELDDYLVIEILNRVDADQTTKILSKMDPKKAANISKQMAN